MSRDGSVGDNSKDFQKVGSLISRPATSMKLIIQESSTHRTLRDLSVFSLMQKNNWSNNWSNKIRDVHKMRL
jgi:hypothetical protein